MSEFDTGVHCWSGPAKLSQNGPGACRPPMIGGSSPALRPSRQTLGAALNRYLHSTPQHWTRHLRPACHLLHFRLFGLTSLRFETRDRFSFAPNCRDVNTKT